MDEKIAPDLLIVEALAPDCAVCNLSRPDLIDWPKSWPELSDLSNEVKSRLPQTHSRLMDLSLAAHFLLVFPEHANFQHARRKFINSLNPDLLPKEIFNGNSNWRLVPVVMVSEGKGANIYYFMVGARTDASCPNWPKWLMDHLDITSRGAVIDAFQAAQAFSGIFCNLFTFPLMPPDAEWNVHGRSMGLPLALAALSTLTGEALSSNLLATGAIDYNSPVFSIEAVADIPVKARAASRNKFRLLLVPNVAFPLVEQFSGMMTGSVSDLKDAWLWARRYAPGNEKDVELLLQMQSDANRLVDNCLNIGWESLEWLIASENGKLLINAILADSGRVKTLVGKLEDCLAPADRDLRHAAALEKFFPDKASLSALEKCSPLLAFKWATLNLKRANHCGENEKTNSWSRTAQELRHKVRSDYPEDYSKFINDLFVSRHNTYTFCPEPPYEFAEAMAEEERCKRGISYVLGCMYGTLAQNFGFCGPGYIDRVLANVKLAQAEFDSTNAPELYDDWIREFSYLVYAHLDAGDQLAARLALHRYLQINSLSEIKPWYKLNPYEQLSTIRYLADTNENSGDSIQNRLAAELIMELADNVFEKFHPNQLITCNLGRLAMGSNATGLARDYFEKSVKLCEQNDETIRVMALLPLSGLFHAGFLTPRHETSVESVLELIRTSRFLNQAYFEPLMEGDIPNLLNLVWKNPARFFPFMYR